MKFGLITGIPRSGTTLAGAIIDQYDTSFCLSEPDAHVLLSQQAESADQFVQALVRAMQDTHAALVRGEAVETRRSADGSPITNYFTQGKKARTSLFTKTATNKENLQTDFTLCTKHNALYTAALPKLIQSGAFRIVAIVRSPIPVISSWRSLSLPISSGRLPAGERFWSELANIAQGKTPLLEKQVLIFELLCKRYRELSSSISIVHYDNMIDQPGLLAAELGIAASPKAESNIRELISPPRIPPDTDLIHDALCSMAAEGLLPATRGFFPELFT
ncbi:MAG: hypothetical protein RLO80_08850 [Hyphomonas sp.]